ncbi:Rne/Rng family ribonuclease [Roseicella sp. DB1501]|uniref:Rne/Rng family ribonuclease n=1 Tax=Roseicella sp. DB1501 TaxID=2730925 RepID=UPI0020C1DBF4|nr:Rne/Rng family ribonuclease [Roseicella sp. DB1501]
MTKRMLIDASHAEETRVVVLDGNRLEEFDLEAATKRPLKGNIYLAKVVRVEPSLQAAFVEYGGNRHGFLAFSEIHPDYYQIPVADRQRLLEMQAAEAREEEEDEDTAPESAMDRAEGGARHAQAEPSEAEAAPTSPQDDDAPREESQGEESQGEESQGDEAQGDVSQADDEHRQDAAEAPMPAASDETLASTELAAVGPDVPAMERPDEPAPETAAPAEATAPEEEPAAAEGEFQPPATEAAPLARGLGEQPELGAPLRNGHDRNGHDGHAGRHHAAEEAEEEDAPPPETIGGEGTEDVSRERRIPPRFLRHYKIQEVIRRRQIMLVQVVKEERGTKGAALTTYISLAGRFSVLMPNSPRGGGVSRKITSATDRKRLREVIDELGLPQGMSLIVRTAGAQRPKPEIRRDCEYLLRLWDSIRERTLESTAPALIYEEADLIKRSIRDVFSRDVEEVLVDGEDAFREAREFMRMLMPQQTRKIQLFRDGGLFARHQVEQQLDAMHSPTVQLRSGGYVVINQTEALVAIDVNSGRSTRERHIEDTALRTNLEAADEIARQLRLRDLAGLIVIDFIDMESSKHDGMVERRLKEALRHDRARIQVGRISHFGLLEMSRQRLRPSLTETTFVICPHCQGRGQVRSVESSALQVLRAIEEEGARRRASEIAVHVHSSCALYLLNRKRDKLAQIEARFGMSVVFEPDDTLLPPGLRIERLRAADPGRQIEAPPAALRMDYAPEPEPEEAEEVEAEETEAEAAAEGEGESEGDRDNRRRRRRRRRRTNGTRSDEGTQEAAGETEGDEAEGEDGEAEAATGAEPSAPAEAPAAGEMSADAVEAGTEPGGEAEGEQGQRRRRRGRRGRSAPEGRAEGEAPARPAQPVAARYSGPTPADPFAGHVDDILAAMEAAEAAAEAAAAASRRARATAAAAPVVEQETAAPAEAPPEVEAITTAPEAGLTEAAMLPPAEADAKPADVQAEDGAPTPEAEAPAAAVAADAPEPQATAPIEPPAASEPVSAPEAQPEPEVVQGQIIQPVSIDALDDAAPRRRGWWKR